MRSCSAMQAKAQAERQWPAGDTGLVNPSYALPASFKDFDK
jgi:hypothetical protein